MGRSIRNNIEYVVENLTLWASLSQHHLETI
jgi:hypothetical protein